MASPGSRTFQWPLSGRGILTWQDFGPRLEQDRGEALLIIVDGAGAMKEDLESTGSGPGCDQNRRSVRRAALTSERDSARREKGHRGDAHEGEGEPAQDIRPVSVDVGAH